VDICIPGDPFTSPDSPLPTPSHPPATTFKPEVHTEPVPTPPPSSESELTPDALNSETLSGPNTTTLVRALTLTLRPGMHLMITGSNGVGKTSVARVLAGLWAPGSRSMLRGSMHTDGALTRPEDDADGRPGVFVIPQRPYHPTGSLLSQVIYPRSVSEFTASIAALSELERLLDAAHLGYLVDREGGWDTVKEWRDVLSGGEKQRVSFFFLLVFLFWCLILVMAGDGTILISS
jgi:ATP-binding cassette subfamily D (ALD) long-chain fatty acid import protein